MGDFVTLAIEREALKLNRSEELERLAEWGATEGDNSTTTTPATLSLDSLRQHEVDNRLSENTEPLFFWMLVLSVTTFVAAFIQRLAWELSAIRQIFRAKKAYIRKMLHMDVAWLESRHSGQVASVLHEYVGVVGKSAVSMQPATSGLVTPTPSTRA